MKLKAEDAATRRVMMEAFPELRQEFNRANIVEGKVDVQEDMSSDLANDDEYTEADGFRESDSNRETKGPRDMPMPIARQRSVRRLQNTIHAVTTVNFTWSLRRSVDVYSSQYGRRVLFVSGFLERWGTSLSVRPHGDGRGSGGSLMEKDSFMKLLVTQLSNQDPMSPSDPTQFVSQLAQFTSLEQLVSVNEGLNVIAMTEAAATSAQMVSYVGKDVVVADDKLYLDGSGADQNVVFNLESNAAEVTVTITNAQGDVVRTMNLGSESAGQVNVTFDGRDDDGDVLPEGTYTYSVTANDKDGEAIGVNKMSRGHVTSVVFENGYP